MPGVKSVKQKVKAADEEKSRLVKKKSVCSNDKREAEQMDCKEEQRVTHDLDVLAAREHFTTTHLSCFCHGRLYNGIEKP